jgi:signal transduction histidine kinase
MDDSKEGLLLIGTVTVILIVFLITVLAVMLIYRKRRLDHSKEIAIMNEKFARELLQTQLEVQQQTMQYIGREIHDDVGQKLVLAVLYVQQFSPDTAIAEKKVNEVVAVLNDSLRTLRNLTRSLVDANVLDIDLCSLLAEECRKVGATEFCAVKFDTNITAIDVSMVIKSFVLRIVQEFMQNSLKHSGCSEITVNMHIDENGLNVFATDNGKGFDRKKTDNNTGNGLQNMQKRADMMGARFGIESLPGNGTRMKLFIPSAQLNK